MDYFRIGRVLPYTKQAIMQNRTLLKEFLATCEVVKDLPDQNGDEQWARFNSVWSKLQAENWATSDIIQRYASKTLRTSPLFEILFEPHFEIKQPTTFTSAGRHPLSKEPAGPARVELGFTAKEFIATCIELNTDYKLTKHIGAHSVTPKFWSMVDCSSEKQVNVLEFLSTEMTDDLLEECLFLKALVHEFIARPHHVITDCKLVEMYIKILNSGQGYYHAGSQLQVPPYPRIKHWPYFDYAAFLKQIQAAEADIDQYKWPAAGANIDQLDLPNYNDLESFDVLHKTIRCGNRCGIRCGTGVSSTKSANARSSHGFC